MLHGPHPLGELLGQISGSNCWVKIVGQIGRSNSWVKFMGQICRSNCWVKSIGRIAGSNAGSNCCSCNARRYGNAREETQPILGLHRASLGQRTATPSNGPKTGKDGRGRGKEKAALCGRGLAWIRSEGDQWVLYVTLKVSLFQQARHEPHTLP